MTARRLASRVLLALMLALPVAGKAGTAGACTVTTENASAEARSVPAVNAWYGYAVRARGAVPDCLDWPVEELNAAVEANGRFVEPGGWDAVLTRLGAISAQRYIRYWSQRRGRWRGLFDDAAALSAPAATATRADFLPAELEAGRTLYLKQRPNGAEQDTVMRLDVLERSPERLVVVMENVDHMPVVFFYSVQPSQTRLAIIIEAESVNTFSYRSVMGLDLELGPFLRRVGNSMRHRSVALFRYIAGIPTDLEPPAAL